MKNNAYSVVIPAYNEEKWLPVTLGALNRRMAAVDLPGEVIVVDNNSKDETAQIARRYNARVVFEPVNQISRARNAGARAARGVYLIFLDADTVPSQRVLQAALSSLASGTCCGGGTRVASVEPTSALARLSLAFWNRLSSALGLAAGCFIFCLREGFDAIGGFSERVYAGEEIFFSRKMSAWGKKRGMTFRIMTEFRVFTSMRKVQWLSLFQALQLVLILACPLALRIRALCAFWYRRPPN